MDYMQCKKKIEINEAQPSYHDEMIELNFSIAVTFLIDPKRKMVIATTLLITFVKMSESKVLKHECVINKSKNMSLKCESIVKSKTQKDVTTTLQITFMNNKTKTF